MRSRASSIGDLIGQPGRDGAILGREDEAAQPGEARLLREVEQEFEIRIRLSRKADQHGGPERAAGYFLLDARYEFARTFFIYAAPHGGEHGRGDVLERHVDVLAHLGEVAVGVE